MPTVALVTNDPLPDDTSLGASYTRFVLPFAYWPQRHRGDIPTTVYEHTRPPRERARRQYLTSETSEVLFDRALWLELSASDEPATSQHEFTFSTDSKEPAARLTLRRAKPQLVLFEWAAHEARVAAKSADLAAADLLHTGFLLLDVSFASTDGETPTLADLQRLNEYYRLWQQPFDGYGSGGYLQFFGLDAADDHPRHYFERWARHLVHPFRGSDGTLWELFPNDWRTAAAQRVVDGLHPRVQDGIADNWIAYPDPRAFVWTCACMDGGAAALSNHELQHQALPADWIRLLNVDAPSAGSASPFEQAWAAERSYTRWMHRGTLYGVCAHAGAVMAPPLPDPPIHRHFAEMYFDQTLLLLYLRVSTFRFSRQLSAMSSRARTQGLRRREPLTEEFQQLRFAFALLTNLYRFPLLSHQQQGIELYTLARKHLDIEDLFHEVQSEVQATDEFLSSATQLEHATMATRLTVVATIALAVALGLDFLQVPDVPAGQNWGALLLDMQRWTRALSSTVPFVILTLMLVLVARPLARLLECVTRRIARSGSRRRRTR